MNYILNIGLAFANLVGAILFVYRPNGDGWFHSVMYCFDCLCNAIAGGDPEETISSRAGKAMQEGKQWGCILCKLLNVIQKDHCIKSINPNAGKDAIFKD